MREPEYLEFILERLMPVEKLVNTHTGEVITVGFLKSRLHRRIQALDGDANEAHGKCWYHGPYSITGPVHYEIISGPGALKPDARGHRF